MSLFTTEMTSRQSCLLKKWGVGRKSSKPNQENKNYIYHLLGDLAQVLRNKVPFTLEAIPLKDPTGAGRFP